MNKYSCREARWRVAMKRVLRLNGFGSLFINDLETKDLEAIVTPFQNELFKLLETYPITKKENV